MASPSCTTPTALASDALRPPWQRLQVSQQSHLGSGSQRLSESSHTRSRASPPSRPRALIGRAPRALRPRPAAADQPGHRPQGRRAGATRAGGSLAPGLVGGLVSWLAGSVAILSPGNSVARAPGLRGMRLDARLKNGRRDWRPVYLTHGHGLPWQAQVALTGLGTGTLSG